MDGLGIKVKTTDGVEKSFPLRPRTIVAFEQKYGKGLAKLLQEDQRLEHIYVLAWETMRNSGVVVKTFGPEFLDTLEAVELTTDESFGSTETA